MPTSYDLETSLHLIEGALSMLIEHWDDLSDARRREIVSAAAKRARRLTDVTDASPDHLRHG